MFKCILCFSSSKLNKPVELTKKVNNKLTLEDCIRQNLNCADVRRKLIWKKKLKFNYFR